MLGVVDFIRKYGWLVAIQQLRLSKEAFKKGSGIYSNSFVGLTIHKNQNHGPLSNSDFSFYFEELEMFIEAKKLIEENQGLNGAKNTLQLLQLSIDIGLHHGIEGIDAKTEIPKLKQAITLIEEI